MDLSLNDAEYFADTISKRVEQLLAERDTLKHELSMRLDGNLENNKAFVRGFQESIISHNAAADRIAKLERILLMRN
ncbi:MAG: hypothetical protein IJ859_13355 [Synergistaceae bacterium]|nr:hypothetical protein [Synergistaceae bacterium]